MMKQLHDPCPQQAPTAPSHNLTLASLVAHNTPIHHPTNRCQHNKPHVAYCIYLAPLATQPTHARKSYVAQCTRAYPSHPTLLLPAVSSSLPL